MNTNSFRTSCFICNYCIWSRFFFKIEFIFCLSFYGKGNKKRVGLYFINVI